MHRLQRKIFHGQLRFTELIGSRKAQEGEVPAALCRTSKPVSRSAENKIDFTKAVMYKTVCSDLSDLSDVLTCSSSSRPKHIGLYKNFPVRAGGDRIAVFGPPPQAAEAKDLRIDVGAPNPKAPSMTMAIENHILGKD